MSELMNAIVEMFRNTANPKEPAAFSCPLKTWEFLWELAQTFGWRPKGATYAAPPGRKISSPVLHNYQPGEALDRKWVDDGDALAWAAALDVARRSPHLDAMLNAHCVAAGVERSECDELRLVLDRFMQFARIGAFEFAVAAVAPEPTASDSRSKRQGVQSASKDEA